MATRKAPGVTVRDHYQEVRRTVQALADVDILVGFPEESTERENAEDGDKPITNAALGYIHDNGLPENHIPARPFMLPGVEAAKPEFMKRLRMAGRAALNGNAAAAEAQLIAAGMAAQLGIQNKINEGIEPALSDRTLRARAAKGRKGAQLELERREKGYAPMTVLAKPLIDTGEMRKSVKYVIRSRKKRK